MNFSKVLIVGAGFSGAVLAERIASVLNIPVIVIDRKNHIGGNSFSEIDPETGIECHKYGSHIFHTNNRLVWRYIQNFSSFSNYQHKVLSQYRNKIYQLPINLKTINEFYDRNFKPSEAEEFIRNEAAKSVIPNPRNLEEKAISLIGEPLYRAFIEGYTWKQWECDPRELPASIITRLPFRNNYNANYFDDSYQGIPLIGYNNLFRRILNHENITLQLNTDFFKIQDQIPLDYLIIYTGMLDELFGFKYGPLQWRSLRFEWETFPVKDFQGNSVINYPERQTPYTRIHEFKHYHPERELVFASGQTIICREYSITYQNGMESYYPVNNEVNNKKYALYKKEADQIENLFIAGRLGTYKYLNMDQAIEKALLLFEKIKDKFRQS